MYIKPLQALFDAATSEYQQSTQHTLVLSSPSSTQTHTTACSSPVRTTTQAAQVSQVKLADCTLVDSKKNPSPGKSLSQGKLRVINQGIQSENIQSPSLAEYRNKARRRSGQTSGFSSLQPSLPPLCPSASPSLHPAQPPQAPQQLPRGQGGVRLLSVGDVGGQDSEGGQRVAQECSSSETESESGPSPHDPGLSTPGL